MWVELQFFLKAVSQFLCRSWYGIGHGVARNPNGQLWGDGEFKASRDPNIYYQDGCSLFGRPFCEIGASRHKLPALMYVDSWKPPTQLNPREMTLSLRAEEPVAATRSRRFYSICVYAAAGEFIEQSPSPGVWTWFSRPSQRRHPAPSFFISRWLRASDPSDPSSPL